MKRKSTGNTGVRAQCGRFVYAGQWVEIIPVGPELFSYPLGVVTRWRRRWVIDHKQNGQFTDLKYRPVRHMRRGEIMGYLTFIHLRAHSAILSLAKKRIESRHDEHVRAHSRLLSSTI